jgi:hypothetical protein
LLKTHILQWLSITLLPLLLRKKSIGFEKKKKTHICLPRAKHKLLIKHNNTLTHQMQPYLTWTHYAFFLLLDNNRHVDLRSIPSSTLTCSSSCLHESVIVFMCIQIYIQRIILTSVYFLFLYNSLGPTHLDPLNYCSIFVMTAVDYFFQLLFYKTEIMILLLYFKTWSCPGIPSLCLCPLISTWPCLTHLQFSF